MWSDPNSQSPHPGIRWTRCGVRGYYITFRSATLRRGEERRWHDNLFHTDVLSGGAFFAGEEPKPLVIDSPSGHWVLGPGCVWWWEVSWAWSKLGFARGTTRAIYRAQQVSPCTDWDTAHELGYCFLILLSPYYSSERKCVEEKS